MHMAMTAGTLACEFDGEVGQVAVTALAGSVMVISGCGAGACRF